ncbi:isoprenylcysteine carboxyl methyltransferase family protein [Cytobacillus massiliigabonensis]|uniref:isoprenylcysteine carboxyl methyltransferase family protein n=1 Tax=Cytobacillus massiliigabonensis TaxID=1871011 RepID=UPI000C84047F|nr:isoprenylcysteine carboxylmethyltransferase family protein [Cytobacillus massiliigabonensis]
MLFYIFVFLLICQRVLELLIAKRNEHRMKQKGAIEFGQSHYPFIVAVHCLFFVSLIIEVTFYHSDLSPYWAIFLLLFFIAQFGRLWALTSLGTFWNTKIIVLPEAKIVKKGPYRYVKHPNYIIVAIELIVIPLLFQANITAIVFTILNAMILSIRIPAEERALKSLTEYKETFAKSSSQINDVKKV